MIYLEDGSVVPVDKSELPILTKRHKFKFEKPLEAHANWKQTKQKIHRKKSNSRN